MSGIVDDLRKTLQDLVTPDLKATTQQVSTIEKTLLPELSAKIDRRIADIDRRISDLQAVITAQMKALEVKVDLNHLSVLNALNLDRRISDVERQLRAGASTETRDAAWFSLNRHVYFSGFLALARFRNAEGSPFRVGYRRVRR